MMDIAQNSISAGATLIEIEVAQTHDSLVISIRDNGCGMSREKLSQVEDPFYTTRTTRDVGLGIPLFKMEAEMTGGNFSIDSEIGVGTRLQATFMTGSIDMIPLGDINGIIHLLVTCNPDIDFLYERKTASGKEMALDTREIKQILGEDVSLAQPEIVLWIKEYLEENTQELLEA